jgi:hypothetical protein
MIRGNDIVCLSFVTWDDHWGTPQQQMSRLARGNRVLFVDQPVSLLSFLTGIRSRSAVARQFRRWLGGPRKVMANVWAAAPPPVLPMRYHRLPNAINAWILRRWLKRTARRLGMQSPIFWNFQPGLPGIGRAVSPRLSIYHCVDDFASVPHWWNPGDNVRAREEECCREANLVICTGRKLVEARRHLNPNVHFVPEGADVALFETASDRSTAVPADAADLPRPVIGYIGVIDFRLDVPLIERIAAERPGATIMLVGPVKSDAEELARLRAMPNVRFYGSRPIEQLPAYLKAMDVCLIPYVLNDYTHHIFP